MLISSLVSSTAFPFAVVNHFFLVIRSETLRSRLFHSPQDSIIRLSYAYFVTERLTCRNVLDFKKVFLLKYIL